MKIYAILLSSLLIVGLAGCGVDRKSSAASAASSASSETAALKKIHEIVPASETIFQEASALYAKGKNREALLTCDKALEIDRENYKALSLKGLILALDVSPEQGIGQVLKALKINPDYTQAFYDMAMAQKLAKHYDESISYFQKVLAVDPQNTWSLYGIATNYADKRDKANALSYLEKAMALDPEHVCPEALSQDHFEWLRGDADFQKVVGGK
ncbi:MAG: hypothetical protein SO089_01225 [Dialister sp.]|nr:hypothetical protein [Dialister sp.]MDY4957201.1 hypothetical protein [Dialister sp.]